MTYASNQLEISIIRSPAVVSLDTKLMDAMARMGGASHQVEAINAANGSSRHDDSGSSYLVIVDGEQVVGLLTERDVVRFAVQQLPLAQLTLKDVLGEILKKPPITVRESALTDLGVVLGLFQKHQLSHLLILDERARLVGVISRESLQPVLSASLLGAAYDATGQERGFIGTVTDISDRKRAESLLEDQYKILEKIAKAEPLQDIFQAFLTAMETYLPETACSIILCQKGHLCHPFAPSLPTAYVEAVTNAVVPIAEGVGSCGTAAYRRAMVISADIATDPLWQNFKHMVVPYGIKACWSMPVFGRDQSVLAVFGIYAREKGTPQPSDIEFVSKLTNLAGIAIERLQSTQALQQLNQELENRVEERTAELLVSEQRWQLALQGANDGIWDWNPQTNQLFWSQRLKEIRGFNRAIQPSSLDDCVNLIHPDDRDEFSQAIEAHLAGKSEFFELEYRVRHQNGSYIWILSRAQAQRNALGQAVRMIGSETDITQRKTVEEVLILKQNYLEALLNNIPHMAWLKDEHSRFIAVNQPFAHACDTAAEALVGKTDYGLWPDELVQSYRDDDAQVLLSGQRKVVEERVARADGTWGWLETTKTPFKDEQGTFVGTVGIAADITERKHYEQQLQELSERLELAIKSALIGIWDWLYQSDRLSWDERMFEIYGVDPETFGGTYKDWEKCVHPDDVEKAAPGSSNESHIYKEFRIIRPDGSIRYIVSTVVIQYDEQGQPIRAVGTNVDITDRKAAQLALQASEAKFQRITESVPGVIYQYVLHPDGRDEFTYISPQIRQLYELEPETVLQDVQLMWDILHPDDVFRVLEAVQVSAESLQPFSVETRVRLPQDRTKWVQLISRPEQHGNGDVVWDGVIVDISDRKQAEEKLNVLSERLQLAIESAEIGIWEWNIEDNTLIWDNRMFALYGIAPEDFSGHYEDWLKLLHPEDLARIKEQEEAALREHGYATTEFRIVRPDGEVRFLYSNVSSPRNEQGDIVRTIGLDMDITERKQAEIALEKEVLRRAAVFNASPDGIHIMDRSGNLVEANASFAQMLGYSPEEVSHLNVADWDAQWSDAELKDIFKDYPTDTYSKLETLHRRKDGVVFPVEITECSMEWNGEFALVCIARDISERKRAEVQLKRTNQELARATRLKDEFLANMSHELRTPLNAILGMTEGLQDEVFGPVNGQQLNALTTIEQSGSHLLELINEILDLAKIEAGNIELIYASVSVAHLCQSSLTFVKQQSLEKGVQLHLKTPWDLPPIRVDERRIRQVLINLLNNAVKFTPSGGSVTLSVVPSSSDEVHGQRSLRFAVQDTGIGISSDELNHLFQPFVQIDSALNRQYDGTGLGLALVKRIVELHGGHVTVTSAVDVGSCFTIELPYDTAMLNTPVAEKTSAFARVETPNLEQKTESPLILLAEDNEANIVTLSSYLQAKGYRIQVATNGQEAIALVQAEVPQAILMDIQLPDMDGLTAIQHIRQLPSLTKIPIIALTALAMEGDQTRCLAAGADKYLSKPVKLKQLVASIQELIT